MFPETDVIMMFAVLVENSDQDHQNLTVGFTIKFDHELLNKIISKI